MVVCSCPFSSDYSHLCPPLVSCLELNKKKQKKRVSLRSPGEMIEASCAEPADGGVHISPCGDCEAYWLERSPPPGTGGGGAAPHSGGGEVKMFGEGHDWRSKGANCDWMKRRTKFREPMHHGTLVSHPPRPVSCWPVLSEMPVPQGEMIGPMWAQAEDKSSK